MADPLDGTIANAWCDLSDIEDVTHQRYLATSEPSISTAIRKAETCANDLTVWLTGRGKPGKTPATVTDQVEAKALRVINALKAARELLRDQHNRGRPNASEAAADLELPIDRRQEALLDYYKGLETSASDLGSDITDGNTATRDDGDPVEKIEQYVRHDSRF